MAANYNNSAWFYDRLSKMIYGKALVHSQVCLLQFIPPESRILIAGGGTGWILEEIANIQPSGLTITYIEVAPKMMELSKKRNAGNNEVLFINDVVENVPLPDDFDVVITPFLFDNFTEGNFQKIFAHIHNGLKPGGIWLNTDFRLTGKWWQKVLLRSMFLFFRTLCGIEANKLPDIWNTFERYGCREIEKAPFFGDFILSVVYKKQIRN
ncbi:MAG: class I SAM-dependent methyltransferase [Bacteroidetes bacterium]|nr:class I SAM-dependent methyltransferase [Bacteroidota bacterium]